MPYSGHISCLLRSETILLQILQQTTLESKLGVIQPSMSMAVTWHRLRVGPSDMYLTRKASFKDTLFIGMQQGSPLPVFQGRVSGCTFTRCKHPDYFLCYMSGKYTLRGYFWLFLVFMLLTCCHVNRLNQYDFSTLHQLYIWGHWWILAILLIFLDWFKHSNTNIGGS